MLLPEKADATLSALLMEFGSVAASLTTDAKLQITTILQGAERTLILALGDLHRAALDEKIRQGPLLSRWRDVNDYLWAKHAHSVVERFSVLYLNSRNILIADETIGVGSLDQIAADPRHIVLRGLQLGAASFILVHNHPSGDPTPSKADVEATARILRAGQLFKMACHDHIILASEGLSSFRHLGLL
jgi:DNA repair protein RadC